MPPPPQPPAGPPAPTAPNQPNSGPTSPQPETGTVMLSDVMGRDRSVNVFAGFTRDFAAISNRFDDITQNSTVLAPLNSAIEALPRKPWEDPEDYRTQGADAYEGPGGQERAQENLRRFVEAHIVPVSPWPEHYKANALVGDGEMWWETTADGKRVLQPGNIEVSSVASTVANGQVWIIKGVRNYST
ncbi:fas1 domain-containing protein [Ophiostoma piceae UAMH 11346]|uniref:Fas1 domain-containing protein n=1 Tax=Ophiostoma piceae (strain UAMH 11346) TaxID=1262450 RepID=S3CF07_OPHP1|nr:fas1 domain-containing protein [Ophiostoma piceae UAMH 11346]